MPSFAHRALALLAVAACSHRDPKAGEAPHPTAPTMACNDACDGGVTTLSSAVVAAPLVEPSKPEPEPLPLEGKVVLHVGDSMAGNGGLTKELQAKLAGEGAKLVREFKVSESIATFDRSKKFRELLTKHDPDIVIVTLGANDALIPAPQVMASHVQSIVKKIGGRTCFWIGPPMWRRDTGIVDVIRENAAPCEFYDSSLLKLARAGDGIHPTDRGGAVWADRFWTFFRSPREVPNAIDLRAGATN